MPVDVHPLGRIKNHDPQSRSFAAATPVDRSNWKSKAIRLYDPRVNPNQTIGNCTGCAKSMQLNALGNTKPGVLGMPAAVKLYSRATEVDPWEGSYPPDDTGSSGLASCKAAQEILGAGRYEWEFRGADGVIAQVMAGRVVSVGTRWDYDMFNQDANGLIKPGGGEAGGHQYVIRGYNKAKDLALGRCWWGPGFRDFWIARTDLDDLLRDGGDAHWQAVA
jgi:hypothetical protein